MTKQTLINIGIVLSVGLGFMLFGTFTGVLVVKIPSWLVGLSGEAAAVANVWAVIIGGLGGIIGLGMGLGSTIDTIDWNER